MNEPSKPKFQAESFRINSARLGVYWEGNDFNRPPNITILWNSTTLLLTNKGFSLSSLHAAVAYATTKASCVSYNFNAARQRGFNIEHNVVDHIILSVLDSRKIMTSLEKILA